MRVLEYSNLDQRLVEGVKGTLTAMDVVSEDAFGVGLRVIPSNSKVPKPGTPYAKGRRVLFVLRGSGTLSNGEYYERITAGKFVLLDENERPAYSTQDEELAVLEIRMDATGKVVPPTLVASVPTTMDARPARATTYDAVD